MAVKVRYPCVVVAPVVVFHSETYSPERWSGGNVGVQHRGRGGTMSDSTANQPSTPAIPTTIAEVIRNVEPMGDLGRFIIEDLTAEEEDEFFRILEGA